MPFSLVIRRATPGDEAEVSALWRACGLVVSYNDPAQDFFFALGKENSDVLVGVDAAERIVGTVMPGHDGHRGWLYYVAADPASRKQGIGRQMAEAGEEWLRARDIVKILLLVRETNIQVVGFYERIGFEEIPRTVMQKWLKAPNDGAG